MMQDRAMHCISALHVFNMIHIQTHQYDGFIFSNHFQCTRPIRSRYTTQDRVSLFQPKRLIKMKRTHLFQHTTMRMPLSMSVDDI